MFKSPFDRGGLRFYLVLIVLTNAAISHLPLLDNAPPAVVALLKGNMTGLSILVALPLILLGTAIHFWAKGCLMQNRVVAVIGPYRYVRHPFYLANGLVDASIAVMSGWWLLMLLLPFWWLAIYVPVMRGEERHLIGIFGDGYRDYMKAIPRLIPFRRPLPANGQGFSWTNHNIAEGMEIPRACRLLAYPLVFMLWGQLWTNGDAFFSDTYHLRLLGLSALVLMYGLSLAFRKHLKLGRVILPAQLRHPAARVAVSLTTAGIALLVGKLELEIDALTLTVGAVFMAVSAVAFSRRNALALLFGEGLTLVGVSVLCELPWLAAAPALFYAALIMDTRLAAGGRASTPPESETPFRLALPALYYVLVVLGPLCALLKELVLNPA